MFASQAVAGPELNYTPLEGEALSIIFSLCQILVPAEHTTGATAD